LTSASAAGVRRRITSCAPRSRGPGTRAAPPEGPSSAQRGAGLVPCVEPRSREAPRDVERCYPTPPQQVEYAPRHSSSGFLRSGLDSCDKVYSGIGAHAISTHNAPAKLRRGRAAAHSLRASRAPSA
jgi:hypothetical protein